MNKCPHCDKKAIDYIDKGFLGPGRKVACMECGEYISVTRLSFLLYVAAVILGLIAAKNSSGAATMGLLTINATVFIWIHIKYLHLVKK